MPYGDIRTPEEKTDPGGCVVLAEDDERGRHFRAFVLFPHTEEEKSS